MVKGISKQVIVVPSPDKKLFDQAIFILKDGAVGEDGVTDEVLLKEAKQLIRNRSGSGKHHFYEYGAAWACIGAALMGSIWLLTLLL